MDVRQRIASILESSPVVLFMKGSRGAPQCGFSAKVVDLLDEHLLEYRTVDVLADPELREGIKEHGQWPTIPQLYVHGKLIGGADIVSDMAKSGELSSALGVPGPLSWPIPEVNVLEGAIAAFRAYSGAETPRVRITIDRAFEAALDIEEPRAGDVVIDLGAMVLSMDRASARRADGITIDFVEGPRGKGFAIENRSAPPKVHALAVEELAQWRQSGKPHLLLDVRTPEERAIARIAGSELFDEAMRARLEDLDRGTTIALVCHHGMRSRAAAEHLVRMGFRDVWNVEGGIDAWSARVDPASPRY